MRKKRLLSFRLWLCKKKKEETEQPFEAKKETKQPIEEWRKRKRNTKDAKIEQEEEEDEEDELISNVAYVVMKNTLQQKSFIGERGFNKLISPFREVIEKRRWNLFCKHKPVGFASLV